MSNQPDKHLRAHLPIPEVPKSGLTTYDAKDPDTTYPPIEPLRPPAGAPNVLIILLDDAGFGSSSAFGGPCHTPTFEKLAAGGLRYNRFHTCALCAPTRQALMTGRNHHSVGMGNITEIATSAPGQNSLRPNTKAPIALTLKLNGYSTAMFGKCHEVPVWESSPMGPFEHWPSGGGGFEYFYGFIGGESNQWDPALYEGQTPVEPPATPEEGYHLTEDLADHAVNWIRQQKALMPDKPFFVYFSTGATHAPHHVPKEWADKYKGKFAQGWDKVREETFARQKALGVIPQDAELTRRHTEIPAWEDMPAELKPVLEREMEVYAGFMEHTDYHVGRVIDAIEDLGVLDDTLIFCIIGDNGASAEGTLNGAFNEMANFNGMAALETPEFMLSKMDEFGSPESYNHYAVGWAHAMDAPYQWTKQVASHWGGTRNGTIVHWPMGISEKGGLRSQFCHVIDVAPTILEAAGLPEPVSVNGVQQSPMEGTSMAYSFNEANAPERHYLQYFEMFGNRGLYYKGWSAVTKHRTPWLMVGQKMVAFDDDIWELYDGSKDFTQANDQSKEMPDMLHKLQRLWLIEATKYNVIPLDDRQAERILPRYCRAANTHPGQFAVILPRDGTPVGKQCRQHEEQIVLRHRRDRACRQSRQWRDHRPGWPFRRLERVCQGWHCQVHLQCAGHPRISDRGDGADSPGQASGANGICLRRRRPGQGRQRHAVLRWQGSGQRSRGRHPADDILGGRDDGYRLRVRHACQPRLQHQDQQVHRQDSLGAARRGQGRSRPLHRSRGAPAYCHGKTVSRPEMR